MHVPAAINVAVVPLTVQTPVVCEANATDSPELAVAVRVKGVPTVCVAGVLNVIVCDCSGAAFTVKVAGLLVVEPSPLLMVTVNVAPLSAITSGGVV